MKKYRLTGILSLLLLSLAAFGQGKTVTLACKGETIQQVLDRISSSTSYNVLVRTSDVDLSGKVDIDVADAPVGAVLDRLFSGTDVKWSIDGNNIQIYRPRSSGRPSSGARPQESRRTYTGTVRDEDGAPVIGAAILVGTSREGVTTDLDGRFSIQARPGQTLQVTSLGYVDQTIRLADQTDLSVLLPVDKEQLDEVVVIGYGTSSKKLVSSSIASVKMAEIEVGANYDPMKALQGRVTGVNVVSGSGTPGAKPNVIVRGVSSISGGSSPLYVVDGIPAEKYPAINHADIESMEVLKDASATAIYGSRANAGVIIITTKSGAKGQTRVDVSSQTGVSEVAHDIKMAGTDAYIRTFQEAVDNYNVQMLSNRTLYIPDNPADFDWVGAVSRRWALTSSHNVSLSGGADKIDFYVSAGLDTQQGYISCTDYQKWTGRAKFGYKISPWVKLNLNSAVAYSRVDQAEETSTSLKVIRTAREEQPWYTPYQVDGSYMVMTKTGLCRHNPVMLVNEESWYVQTLHLSGTVSLDITPFKGFRYTPSVSGYGIFDFETKRLTDKHDARAFNTGWAAVSESKDHSFRYVIDNILSYEGKASDLRYSVMAGHSLEKYQYETFGFMSSNYANEAYPSAALSLVTSGAEIFADGVGYNAYALESWFSRMAANWKDRYILNLSLRSDGSSRFPKENRFGTFPAASLAWIASNEKFFPRNPWVDELKVRVSAGQTGSMAGIGNWAAMSLVDAGSSYNGASAFTVGTPAQNVRWEKSTKYDGGLDLTLLGGRLDIEADVFYSITNDMLYSKPVLSSTGMTTLNSNIGSADNRGFEFAVNGRVLQGPVNWDLGFNISSVRSRLVNLLDGTDSIIVSKSGSNLLGGQQHILKNGEPISSWYMYKFMGIYQYDEDVPAKLYAKGVRAGDCIYQDENLDGDIDENDRVLCGKATPDFYGGLTSNLSWKGFELNVFCTYSLGNKLMAAWKGVDGVEGCEHLGLGTNNVTVKGKGEVTQYYNISAQAADGYWRGPGTSNTIPRPILAGAHTGYDYDYNVLTSTRYLEDASYFKVKTVTLAWNIPQSISRKIGIGSAKAFITIDNALCLTGYDGYDPEASYNGNPSHSNYGVDFGLSPIMRSYLAGIQLKF